MPQRTYITDIEEAQIEEEIYSTAGIGGLLEQAPQKREGLNQMIKDDKECPNGKVLMGGKLESGILDAE